MKNWKTILKENEINGKKPKESMKCMQFKINDYESYMYDLIDALDLAERFKDFSQLAELIENEIIENQYARELIAKVLRGKLQPNNKDGGETKKIQFKRNREIIYYIYGLKYFEGIPISSKTKSNEKDAITLAAEKFCKDPDHIRKNIWGKRDADRDYGVKLKP